MEPYCQRLDQSAFQGTDIIRQLKAQICLMGNIFLEYSVYRRSCEKDHIRAQIILAFLAEFTVSAGLSRLQSHSVPYLEMFYIFPHFHHYAAWLMA